MRILSGPPPEYFGPPPVPVTSRPHSSTLSNPDSLSRGGGGKPTSPSALSNGDKDRSFSLPSSPGHQSPRRKLATPLPEVPKQEVLEQKPAEKEPERKEEEEEEDEQEEDPYDYAKFDESVNRERIDSPSSSANSPPPPPPPPGGYAVVTRHSESLANGGATNYTEVRQVGGASRSRSSTDPVAVPPPPPSSHGTVTRTYTEGGAHPPLPLPPRNFPTTDDDKDGMYDSIENLKKTYDSLDNEDDNEMYESVPEDFKEEILSSSVPTHGPRYHDNAPAPSSPSPTKVPRIIATGPPDSPRGKGKKGRQRPESTSEDAEKGGHNRLSFFNRIRSSSTSAAVGGAGKKETKKHDSDHTHHQALPLPPQPDQMDEEDDDDTYDSVKPSLVGNSKSATLPVKSVGLFSSRVNEPLPEVPEDSGSGSASIVVQRDRVLDKSDPNYDTVRKEEREEEEEEEGQEPDYDTVKRGDGSHNYAKVTSHGEGGGQSIGHDAEGYARVDPQIIERKRTNSEIKRKEKREEEEEEEEEDPYDRVKDLGTDDPGYSSVRELKEELANSDTPTQSETPPTSVEVPPTQSPDEESPVHDPELAYAIIDPSVVQRKRVASMGSKDKGSVLISSVPRPDSTSPAPPLPPVGDLGIDLSEFEPPPIPDQSLNDEDLVSPPPEEEEDPYSKVGGATINDTPLDKETKEEETVTMEIRDSVLSLGSSEGGVPVYDSLERQTPLYDSLDPSQQQLSSPSLPPPPLSLSSPSNEQQPTYDCLSPKEDT